MQIIDKIIRKYKIVFFVTIAITLTIPYVPKEYKLIKTELFHKNRNFKITHLLATMSII